MALSPLVTSSLISAGSSLLGGMMGGGKWGATRMANAQAEMNDVMFQDQARSYRRNPEFIVEGAKRAGIHPLVLFGSPMSQPSAPQLVGNLDTSGDNTWSTAMMNMGQDLSRAYSAHQTQKEREADAQNALTMQKAALARQERIDNANLTHQELQNELLRLQIRKNSLQETPPIPAIGKKDSAVVITPYNEHSQPSTHTNRWEMNPAPVTSANQDVQSLTAGPPSPAFKRYRVGGPNFGYHLEVPEGQSFSEGLESMGSIPAMGHTLAHQTLRAVDEAWHGNPKQKPNIPLPAGYHWNWKPFKKVWRAERSK
jgi:hypothetical protein